MKKNDKIKATCESYTFDGHGVVKVNGFPIFVKGLLLHERATIVVTMVKKSFGYGKWLLIEKPSEERVEPVCEVSYACGGCQLQHMTYKHQLDFKKIQVMDAIKRIGHIDTKVEDVLGMVNPTHYRNKAQIPVGMNKNAVVMGFYRIHSNTIIDMNHCYIQSMRINEVMECIKELVATYNNASELRHILIKHANIYDEVMIGFIAYKKDISHLQEMIEILTQKFPQIKSILVNVNTRQDNVILGEKEYVCYGAPTITDAIHNLKFRISMKSFFQVNPIQTEVLYQKALTLAQLKGHETVIDLYCGVGTISMFLAQQAKHVIGIEIVPQAIEDAKINASLNDIKNITFVCSDAATYASKLVSENKQVDVVVVDPPRKGCDQITLESIVKMCPKRIVYVSCKVSTLARDLRILEDLGYTTKHIQPVDMFPQTYGVETVCLLTKNQDDKEEQ